MDKACPFLNKKCIGSFCAFSDRDEDCIIRQFFQSHIDKKYAESEQAALELGWFDEFFQSQDKKYAESKPVTLELGYFDDVSSLFKPPRTTSVP